MSVNPEDPKKPARRLAGVPPFIPTRNGATGQRTMVPRPGVGMTGPFTTAQPPLQSPIHPLVEAQSTGAAPEVVAECADSPARALSPRIGLPDSGPAVVEDDPAAGPSANQYADAHSADTGEDRIDEAAREAWNGMGAGDGLGWDYAGADVSELGGPFNDSAALSLTWTDADVELASADFITGDAASRLDPDVFAPTDVDLPLAGIALSDAGEIAAPAISWDIPESSAVEQPIAGAVAEPLSSGQPVADLGHPAMGFAWHDEPEGVLSVLEGGEIDVSAVDSGIEEAGNASAAEAANARLPAIDATSVDAPPPGEIPAALAADTAASELPIGFSSDVAAVDEQVATGRGPEVGESSTGSAAGALDQPAGAADRAPLEHLKEIEPWAVTPSQGGAADVTHPVADALIRVAERIRSGELTLLAAKPETDAAALAVALTALLHG